MGVAILSYQPRLSTATSGPSLPIQDANDPRLCHRGRLPLERSTELMPLVMRPKGELRQQRKNEFGNSAVYAIDQPSVQSLD